jgi:hypothetical protein
VERHGRARLIFATRSTCSACSRRRRWGLVGVALLLALLARAAQRFGGPLAADARVSVDEMDMMAGDVRR